jgi:hypothetical protein
MGAVTDPLQLELLRKWREHQCWFNDLLEQQQEAVAPYLMAMYRVMDPDNDDKLSDDEFRQFVARRPSPRLRPLFVRRRREPAIARLRARSARIDRSLGFEVSRPRRGYWYDQHHGGSWPIPPKLTKRPLRKPSWEF